MVLNDWAAGRESPLVLNKRGGFSCVIEKISRIQSGVLMEPVRSPMVIVRATLGNKLHLGTAVPSELRREVVRNQLKFLYGIEAKGTHSRRPGSRDVRGCNVVYRDVVTATSLAVSVETTRSEKRVVLAHRCDSRRESRIGDGIPPQVGKFEKSLGIERGAY